jgi:hypothetical protein
MRADIAARTLLSAHLRPDFVLSQQGLSRLGARRQRGQALVFSLFAAVLIIVALFAMYSMNGQAIEKIKLQNTADAAAYSAAVAEARDYNFSAYTNRAMVANQVAVAQFVGMTSWFRNMAAHGKGDPTNAGRTVYQVFFNAPPSPLGNIYLKFLKGMGNVFGIFEEGRPGTTFMSAAVTVLDGLIRVYTETQRIYHYGTALTVAQTLGAFGTIGSAMADLTGVDWFSNLAFLDAAGGLPHLIYHLYRWYNFTERKDPNTENKDGPLADRFAQVTLDSLDDFSRDRSTKPAWGFSFFYAPPLTYIDPTRFIPYQSGPLFLPVIHRGGTELKVPNGTGGSIGADSDGGMGVDCNGNPVTSTSSGTGNISKEYYSQLPSGNPLCEGDSGMVTIGDGTHPKGTYAYDGSKWIDPNDLKGKTPKGGKNTSSGSGNAGQPNNRMKKTWTAMDASSWSGLNLIWISILGIPIPLPIPFAPPWMPLSHGAAQSGKQLDKPTVLASDNNFGVTASEAYGGTASSWTTAISAAMRQNKGAGKSLDMISSLGGLTGYMDVKNVAVPNLVGPYLVVEIEKPIGNMPRSPGNGRFALESGAPQDKMRALSKAEVYFARPTSDTVLTNFKRVGASPNQVELGSLYNPYWQPRLAANNFLEKYLSMEMHRFVGL